ncbi:sigma-70 family RNA polymerase sigma factor [Acinetobacter boissieri]|uniref:RNA polymerase sigma-70 factor, ECF subfamily n=1 Tax=Acinetobacter boissieri TaxID=1219383 RepID=A0A1G6IWR5_9GAMM|nr:sigma-70 family RNA polymerase sigma factor [Acinetobacter boissieri]SDC10525.1 RNA polymerase sigma-70 factor, ECF subfamily [Acinetobacter boissieri]
MGKFVSKTSKEFAPQTQWSELMRLSQLGNEDAYRQLLHAIAPAIERFACYKVSDHSIIDDIVQDSLMSIHTLRHTYDPKRPILPWIVAITSARAIDIVRKYNRHWKREIHDELLLQHIVDESYDNDLEHEENVHQLNGLLKHLTPAQREIIQLVKLDELSLDETSKKTGLSIAAVKSLLHRALTTLRHYGRD